MLTCLVLLVAPADAWSQDDAAVTGATGVEGALTIEQALRLARSNNPALRRAVNEIERATAGERRGWGAYLPQVDGSMVLQESESRRMTAVDEYGEPVALENPTTFNSTTASGRLDASLLLFDGFRRLNRLQAARSGSRAAEAGFESERVRVEADVRRRFYAAIGARRFIEVEERLLTAARDRRDATRAMVEAGRATPQDTLGAEVDVARQEIALESARGDLSNRKVLLSEVIGLDEPIDVPLDGEFPALFDPTVLDVAELVAAAHETSPEIRRGRASLSRAEHSADAARALRWPTLRLSAGIDRGINLPDRSQITDFPWNRGFGVQVSASVPLFSGFQTSEQIANASATHANARETLRETELAVEREVRTALTNTINAQQTVQLQERAASLSRQRLEVAQEGFRRGVVGFTELQQLIERAAQTERAAVNARVQWANAVIALDAAVGRQVRPRQ